MQQKNGCGKKDVYRTALLTNNRLQTVYEQNLPVRLRPSPVSPFMISIETFQEYSLDAS
jgi:hypothetical protein